ncbi:multidrug resistance efflux transporter family protein [Arcobacter sp. LA11]|uniref:multidrug resistance efflux transporter family protein n=1 Tax=Arcobacter sp. LA11 TaxID=1898176 RepID=UPI000B2379AA|nr:multidrug resistance efflux transporter family protein [Arcobacter sp. LA11]
MNKIKLYIKQYESSSSYLLIIGLLAALFFSATFLINRAISLDGGHWYWSATLRFFYTLLFLALGFITFKGFSYFKAVLKEYFEHFKFWTISGTIGFGFFYSLICYAADFSPAWVVATTWQITILASLFVLAFFGQKLSKRVWFFTFIIFTGITLVNISHFDINNLQPLLLGFLPVFIAAFSYPFGNQLVWEEKKKRKEQKKDISVINNAFVKVFLLTLGSFPLWIVLYFFTDATVPTQGQYLSVALIALLSGVIATSLFLYVRSIANTPSKLMIVDASQSGEVFFALLGEMIFLSVALPSLIGFIGIFITILGLVLLIKLDKKG